LRFLTAARAYDANVAPELHIITPEDAPLAIFGTQATRSLIALLEETGIQLHAGVYPEQTGQGLLELRPTGEHVEVDRIVALPRLEGRPVDGLPADALGFLPIDEYACVRGTGDVWAAGDATDFPLKQGGSPPRRRTSRRGPSPPARARPSSRRPSVRSAGHPAHRHGRVVAAQPSERRRRRRRAGRPRTLVAAE
jgi:hypothetical protein